MEQEQQKKNALQSEANQQSSSLAALKARHDQLSGEVASLREGKRTAEDELHRLKTQRSVDELQRKELQDQLEAEQYFSVCTLLVSLYFPFVLFSTYVVSCLNCPVFNSFRHYIEHRLQSYVKTWMSVSEP